MSNPPETMPDLPDLAAPVRAVEGELLALLRERGLPENLRAAIEYAVLGPGKRLRPILALGCCRAVGGTFEQACPAAGAVELVHAFSLVHDDLPAMDDDDLRRGRPTLHRHAGEAMAILAGDAMPMLAVDLLVSRITPAPLCVRLVRELTAAANAMIAGQVYDTLPGEETEEEGKRGGPLDRVLTIHQHKTGALLRAACRMGAISGGATEPQLAAITRYADAVGLMFQVVDDLLDVTESTAQLGKAANKDAARGKLTYPGVLGVARSRAEVAKLEARAMAAAAELGDPAAELQALCRHLAARRR